MNMSVSRERGCARHYAALERNCADREHLRVDAATPLGLDRYRNVAILQGAVDVFIVRRAGAGGSAQRFPAFRAE